MVDTGTGTGIIGIWIWIWIGLRVAGINIDIERYGAGTRTVIRNVVKREKMDSKRLERHQTKKTK